jgi:O-antigen/teichoic acid export membrane protein
MDQSGDNISRLLRLLLVRILPGLINLLCLLMLTRALEPTQYGVYAVTMSSALLSSAIFFHWLVQGVSRFAYAYRDDQPRFLGTVGTGFLLSVILVAVVFPGLILLSRPNETGAIIIAGCAIAIANGLFEILAALAIAELRNRDYALLVMTKASVTAGLVFVLTDRGFVASTALLAVGMGIGAACLSVLPSIRNISTPGLDTSFLKKLMRQGGPLSVHYGLSVSMVFSDRSIVISMLGVSAAGYLSASSDVAGQTLTMLMTVIHMSFYPLLLRAWESGDALAIDQHFRRGFRMMSAVGIPAATCCALFSSNAAHFLMGESFRVAAVGLIPWVTAASLLSAFRLFYADLYFILTGRVLSLIPQSALLLIVAACAQVFVAPRWGLTGVGVVMVLVQILGLAISWVRTRRHFALPIEWKSLAASVSICLLFGLISWPIRTGVGIIPAMGQFAVFSAMCAGSLMLSKWLLRGRAQ